MKMLSKKAVQRLLSVLMIFALCISVGVTAQAVPKIQKEEPFPEGMTEEERNKEEKKRQKQIYDMPVQTNEIPNWPQGPGTYGYAGIVMDVDTGAVLYGKNIDDQHYPASITKVLTALVALENGAAEDPVVFSHDCVSFLQPGDSAVGLKEGDKITLEQALYATLLASGNEAAYAVGENVGKMAGHDYAWFVEQMNLRCKELGGTNSNFVNTNGLHDANHYTSARDMALIGRELFKHPEFFKIVQTTEYKIPKSSTCEEHVFQQKHKMLQPQREAYYKYAVGGKTGFTSDALSTLITMAEKGDRRLVCVVLRTRGGIHIYPDTKNLFEYGFDNFEKISVNGQETSEDVEEILADESGKTSGYVMLPKGAAFADLEMKLTEDPERSGEAVLTYSYGGNFVGSARAKLSQSYLEKHKQKSEKKVTKRKESKKKDKKALGVIDKLKDRSKKEILVLAGLTILLMILILWFFVRIARCRKKRRKRRRRR